MPPRRGQRFHQAPQDRPATGVEAERSTTRLAPIGKGRPGPSGTGRGRPVPDRTDRINARWPAALPAGDGEHPTQARRTPPSTPREVSAPTPYEHSSRSRPTQQRERRVQHGEARAGGPNPSTADAETTTHELYIGELLRREGRNEAEASKRGVHLRRVAAAAAGVTALCGAVAFGASQLLGAEQQTAASAPDHPLRVVPDNRVTEGPDSSALAPQRQASPDVTAPSAAGEVPERSTVPRANPQGGASAPRQAPTTTTAPTGQSRVTTTAPAGSPSAASSPSSEPPPPSNPPPKPTKSGDPDGGVLGPVTDLVGGVLGSPSG